MVYKIGSRISMFREARGLTQKKLAELIGVSKARLSNWEHGVNRPDVDFLARICDALRVSPSEMLDFQLPPDDFSDIERKLIAQYRKKPDIQRAVNILLGIEHEDEN